MSLPDTCTQCGSRKARRNALPGGFAKVRNDPIREVVNPPLHQMARRRSP